MNPALPLTEKEPLKLELKEEVENADQLKVPLNQIFPPVVYSFQCPCATVELDNVTEVVQEDDITQYKPPDDVHESVEV